MVLSLMYRVFHTTITIRPGGFSVIFFAQALKNYFCTDQLTSNEWTRDLDSALAKPIFAYDPIASKNLFYFKRGPQKIILLLLPWYKW